jgi:hypothetical protein
LVNSWFILILHCPFSFVDPYIFLNIFFLMSLTFFPFYLSEFMSLMVPIYCLKLCAALLNKRYNCICTNYESISGKMRYKSTHS